MTLRILIGDIHFGRNADSEQHNQDLIAFLETVVAFGVENNVTHLSMLGDWFDKRTTTGSLTSSYAQTGMEMLTKQFNCIFIPGNHDLYYRDKRTITPLTLYKDKVTLIETPYQVKEESSMYFPWVLNNDEYLQWVVLSKENHPKFGFGHFEFMSFMMNDSYVMEHGQNPAELSHFKHVFSSHYHKRQEKDNVTYIGSPFPFDYGDANDSARGFCVLDTDTDEYCFVDYNKIKILSVPYKKFLSDSFIESGQFTSIKVRVDEVVSQEITSKIVEKLDALNLRGSQIAYETNAVKEMLAQQAPEIKNVENLDTLVVRYLKDMSKVETVDNALLTRLYERAVEEDKDG